MLEDDEVLWCFRVANEAMRMQMRHSKDDLAGRGRERDEAPSTHVGYEELGYRWRPFQLAFILLVLESICDDDADDREKVDLLWFPTGGGKTEAYLAIAAIVLLLRRRRHGGAGVGTTVITRYTLQLLTTQQFQRAATLICALDAIRDANRDRLGREPFTIGLWVGDELTPNRWAKALEKQDEILEMPEPTNVFQLESCPWCGTNIVPAVQSEDRRAYGFTATIASFDFYCPNDNCAFTGRLPVAVVDDELFARPPSFLLATVDKFARLAWEENAGSFFGSATRLPPSLIIQDELHLLSGPLGTMVGLYERAVESLIARNGTRPKVIASTATIRRAPDQIRALYARPLDLFPPAGLEADHSYFARIAEDEPGRRYVGLMSQSHTTATTNVQAAAALLLAPVELNLVDPERDAYWTLVSYHNNLKELGRTITQFRDDVPRMIEARARDQANARSLGDEDVIELTSNLRGGELPRLLGRLNSPGESAKGVSVLATTNMLSVGVDVPRLGLMVVNGQPKTTSEYIQATSRVGRGDVPGLVLTMFASTKPRDRSHYETFVAYHQSLYRWVEPTSVTPFALPARERALHAVFVILVRHSIPGMSANAVAGAFEPTAKEVQTIVDDLNAMIAAADPDEAEASKRHLEVIVASWAERAEESRATGKPLYYYSSSKQTSSLLRNFGQVTDGWETPQSMRNVDRQCNVDVLGGGDQSGGSRR